MRTTSTLLLAIVSVATNLACGPTPPPGVGGAAGTGATGGTGGGGGAGAQPGAPPCVTKGTQIIVLGDSYMNLGDAAAMPHRYTENRARADGSLAAGQSYRLYAVPGTSMATGQIPSQLTQAINADRDIKAVIMTGGGNDILINNRQCLSTGSSQNASCRAAVQAAVDASKQMMQTGANAGISGVVYFFYPHVVPGLLTGTNPNEILDYSLPLAKAACDAAFQETNGRTRCHFIDMRPAFAGKEAQYIKPDNIHPTAAGAEVIGNEIWNKMEQQCVGQGPNSGCCR
jgi:lysophospholipase L1-like esterase